MQITEITEITWMCKKKVLFWIPGDYHNFQQKWKASLNIVPGTPLGILWRQQFMFCMYLEALQKMGVDN